MTEVVLSVQFELQAARRLGPGDEGLDLRQATIEELSKPGCRSDAHRACRRRLCVNAKAVEAILADGNSDAVSDRERLRETLELRRVVGFEVNSAVAFDVEVRHEHSPCQRATVQILHHPWLQLEEELLNPGALRARLICNVGIELVRAWPRQKSESGIECSSKNFDRCVDVPKIIRVVDRCSPSVAATAGAITVTGGCPRTRREILIA